MQPAVVPTSSGTVAVLKGGYTDSWDSRAAEGVVGSTKTNTTTTKTSFGTVTTVATTNGKVADTTYHQTNDRDSQTFERAPTLTVSHASRLGIIPILLDLNGNGVEVRELDQSSSYLDTSGDGLMHRSAWAGEGDGVLFYDVGNDGLIKEAREYVFTEWDPTAKDDMAALRARFDTNGDGKLTALDADFASFKVMVTGPDGTLQAQSLAALGISEIDLRLDATQRSFDDGSRITGQTTFVKDGVTKTAAAVTLVAEAEGHKLSTATTTTGATKVTVRSQADSSGHALSTQTTTVTTAGAMVTTTHAWDDNGDGAVDRYQVISRVTDGANKVTETCLLYTSPSPRDRG